MDRILSMPTTIRPATCSYRALVGRCLVQATKPAARCTAMHVRSFSLDSSPHDLGLPAKWRRLRSLEIQSKFAISSPAVQLIADSSKAHYGHDLAPQVELRLLGSDHHQGSRRSATPPKRGDSGMVFWVSAVALIGVDLYTDVLRLV